MKILLAHNHYRHQGGEDEVFRREAELLRSRGNEVLEYTRHNDEIIERGIFNKVMLGAQTLWARDSQRELRTILRRKKPHIVHFHNTFPLISPAAYYTCHDAGIPVVQSLHNARFMCPGATLFRKGEVCQDCLGKAVPWPAVIHACYRNSSLQTAAVAGMLTLHRVLSTWQHKVDAYVVFTQFFRQKFAEAGLPQEKIFVKPHFLNFDPGAKQESGSYALFIGRLSPEKGIQTVMAAWRSMGHVPLTIVGEGPLDDEVARFAAGKPLVRKFPHLSQSECIDLIKGACFVIWPSYIESFGLIAVEAFACGTPVIATRLGVMAELVESGKTGLHFSLGSSEELAAKVQWAWSHPDEVRRMGEAARDVYENKYTAERNYKALSGVYQKAIENRLGAGKESSAPSALLERGRA